MRGRRSCRSRSARRHRMVLMNTKKASAVCKQPCNSQQRYGDGEGPLCVPERRGAVQKLRCTSRRRLCFQSMRILRLRQCRNYLQVRIRLRREQFMGMDGEQEVNVRYCEVAAVVRSEGAVQQEQARRNQSISYKVVSRAQQEVGLLMYHGDTCGFYIGRKVVLPPR